MISVEGLLRGQSLIDSAESGSGFYNVISHKTSFLQRR